MRFTEDKAVEVTCAALGWSVPEDWRERRKVVDLHGIPILDLAVWDVQRGRTKKRKNEKNNNETKANAEIVPACTVHGGQEEKKDAVEEHEC